MKSVRLPLAAIFYDLFLQSVGGDGPLASAPGPLLSFEGESKALLTSPDLICINASTGE